MERLFHIGPYYWPTLCKGFFGTLGLVLSLVRYCPNLFTET